MDMKAFKRKLFKFLLYLESDKFKDIQDEFFKALNLKLAFAKIFRKRSKELY